MGGERVDDSRGGLFGSEGVGMRQHPIAPTMERKECTTGREGQARNWLYHSGSTCPGTAWRWVLCWGSQPLEKAHVDSNTTACIMVQGKQL